MEGTALDGWTVYHKAVTESTNLDARAGKPGDVFTADEQTAGRGRLDHTWLSQPGKNLMMSVVLDVSGIAAPEVATLPLVVGLAAATATSLLLMRQTWIKWPNDVLIYNRKLAGILCERHGDNVTWIKWPNDVLIYNRKLAGILCERHGDNVIAGVGINVNQKVFAPEIALRATSLLQIDDKERPIEMVQRAFLKTLAPFYENWRQDGFASIYPLIAPCDALKGKQISVAQSESDAEPVTGICGGIQNDGTLLVGDTPVFAGEAHVLNV